MIDISFKELSEAVRKRTFEIDCPEIRLQLNVAGQVCKIAGPGSIYIEEGRFKFKFFSKNRMPVVASDTVAGQIVPAEQLWIFSAIDMQDRSWSSSHVSPYEDVSYGSDHTGIIIRGELWQLEARSCNGISCSMGIRMDIPGEFNIPLFDSTNTVTHNPSLGQQTESSKRDTASLEIDGCRITIVKHSSFVRFHIDGKNLQSEIATRVCEAFQFVTARSTWWESLYSSDEEGNYIRLRLRNPLDSNRRMQPPLNTFFDLDYWKLFECYFRYVSQNTLGKNLHAISAFLSDVSEASATSFELYCLILSVAVEGVVKFLPSHEDDNTNVFAVVGRLVEYVMKWPEFDVPDVMREEQPTTTQKLKMRISGLLNTLNQPRAVDRLQAIQIHGALQDDLIRNWKKLRHPAAHGNSFVENITQVEFDKCDKALTLLYQIIFLIIGYTGKFSNYSKHSWPVEEFKGAN